jgi:transposase-like protein
MDKAAKQLQKLTDITNAAAIPAIVVNCPECKADISVRRKAIFEENQLKVRITMKPGHKIQASTLAGQISGMAKILKQAARSLGYKIDVVISDIRFTDRTIEIDYVSMEAGKQEGKNV